MIGGGVCGIPLTPLTNNSKGGNPFLVLEFLFVRLVSSWGIILLLQGNSIWINRKIDGWVGG